MTKRRASGAPLGAAEYKVLFYLLNKLLTEGVGFCCGLKRTLKSDKMVKQPWTCLLSERERALKLLYFARGGCEHAGIHKAELIFWGKRLL